MKLKSNWSLLGVGTGLAFAFLSAWRYFVLWPDTDKAIVYVVIGLLISCVAWLYGRHLDQSNRITLIEDYLSEKK